MFQNVMLICVFLLQKTLRNVVKISTTTSRSASTAMSVEVCLKSTSCSLLSFSVSEFFSIKNLSTWYILSVYYLEERGRDTDTNIRQQMHTYTHMEEMKDEFILLVCLDFNNLNM